MSEPPALTAFRARFEAGRSFDLDDDLEFCPNLLTWDEVRINLIGNPTKVSLTNRSVNLLLPVCRIDHLCPVVLQKARRYNTKSNLTWLQHWPCRAARTRRHRRTSQ